VKLFQIEEPAGSLPDPALPGAAIGVDASSTVAEVAFSVGGNAVMLNDREEFARVVPVPVGASAADWLALFEAVRLRAERLLSRPVTHAAVVLPTSPPPAVGEAVLAAAGMAGLQILRLVDAAELPAADRLALAAALLAEDLMPQPGTAGSIAAYCN
jgi:hypothetical protein